MAYLRTVSPSDAGEAVRAMYDADLASNGYVSNKAQLFSLRPAIYGAWFDLIRAIRAPMDLRRYELATLAAARALRCRYCVGAHTAVLESKVFDHGQVEAIVRDFRHAGLTDAEVAVMSLAEAVASDATRVTPADVEELRGHGLSDAEIFDVVLAAAARCFFSKTLDALGAEPDEEYSVGAAMLDLVELTPVGPR